MPSYFYKAKKDSAHTIAGQIDAQNEDEALDFIHQLGLVPVALEEGNAQGVLYSRIRKTRIKNRELFFFSKQLASLLKSGISLLKALEVIGQQTKNSYFAKVVTEIAVGVKSGRSFSACLSDYSTIFPSLLVAMVRAGEETGNMRQMLNNAADFLKEQGEFSAKVRGAMVYPLIMLSVGMMTVVFILTFVMPKMTVIFKDSGQSLPLPTLIVMAVSHFFRTYGIPLVMSAAAAVLIFNRWRRTPQGAMATGQWVLKVPFVRSLVLKADLSRFAATMHLLLASGLPIVRAIEVAVPTVHNAPLNNDLSLCAQELTAGENLGQSLGRSVLIPPMMVELIALGEESGSLQDSLKDIAETYQADIQEMTRLVTTVLEPVMILAVGAVVGLIVFAMLLPIFSMDLMAQ